jgi:hypothetical protein
MTRTAMLLGGFLAVVQSGALLAQPPVGQAPPARYEPARPTVSPYLNLLRRDIGPIPNYHTLVRPQLQQREHQQRQQIVNAQRQGDIRTLNRRVLELTEPSVAATGAGGGFRNYSHYYPSLAR